MKHIINKMIIKVAMIKVTPIITPMMTLVESAVCIETFDQTSTHNLVTKVYTYMLVKGLS